VIRIIFTQCNWGTDAIEGGIQINLLDTSSQIMAHAPFQGDSLAKLVSEIAEKGLTPEQKRELAPLFNGGIIMPGPGDFDAGPQG